MVIMLMDDVKFQQSLPFHGSLPSITSSDLKMSINNNNNNDNNNNKNDNIITNITTSSNNNIDPVCMNLNAKDKNTSTTSTRIQSPCYGNFTSSTISPITSPMALDQWSATLLAAQALVRTKKVFIGGVSTGTTTDELKTFFSEFGKLHTSTLSSTFYAND
ncbi:RNA-binding protein Musashi [Schistosoma japonicum]|nr:RNA-binding protein Musashi [Schistosoma japonicum]